MKKEEEEKKPVASDLAKRFAVAEANIDKKLELLKNKPFKDWFAAEKAVKSKIFIAPKKSG